MRDDEVLGEMTPRQANIPGPLQNHIFSCGAIGRLLGTGIQPFTGGRAVKCGITEVEEDEIV